jgi:hypothetical protein
MSTASGSGGRFFATSTRLSVCKSAGDSVNLKFSALVAIAMGQSIVKLEFAATAAIH